jgi:hypothetical protein
MSSTGYVLGFIGAVLMVASYLMKSMLPLRLVALAANLFLVGYAVITQAWPTMLLYLAMIPINLKKVLEIRRLMRAMRHAKADAPVADWLLPHMRRREVKAGTVLWKKDDVATEMVYVDSGRLRLVEQDKALDPGSLVGEIGLFAPQNRRTGTVVCDTDCTLFGLSADAMAQLYYLNPKLGFYVMRLVVARLINDAERARAHAQLPPSQQPAPTQL